MEYNKMIFILIILLLCHFSIGAQEKDNSPDFRFYNSFSLGYPFSPQGTLSLNVDFRAMRINKFSAGLKGSIGIMYANYKDIGTGLFTYFYIGPKFSHRFETHALEVSIGLGRRKVPDLLLWNAKVPDAELIHAWNFGYKYYKGNRFLSFGVGSPEILYFSSELRFGY